MPPSTSLVSSGALSHDLPAELRLAQAISEFALNLDDAGKQKFQQLQVQLSRTIPPSPADVIALTEDFNREGASRHSSWRPAPGTRIGGFLRRIQPFAVFGDILIGGSQNLIASGVWATVRAMLEVTLCTCHFYHPDHHSGRQRHRAPSAIMSISTWSLLFSCSLPRHGPSLKNLFNTS